MAAPAGCLRPPPEIPSLLRRLACLPAPKDNNDGWSALWSALAHRGDVHLASVAAVPNVVDMLAASPVDAPHVRADRLGRGFSPRRSIEHVAEMRWRAFGLR